MTQIIIAVLATYGVATIVTEYPGPFYIIGRFRDFFNLPDCTVCLSIWIGISIAYFAGIGVIDYLSVIGGVLLLDRIS